MLFIDIGCRDQWKQLRRPLLVCLHLVCVDAIIAKLDKKKMSHENRYTPEKISVFTIVMLVLSSYPLALYSQYSYTNMIHKQPDNGLLVGYLLILSLHVPSALRLCNDS